MTQPDQGEWLVRAVNHGGDSDSTGAICGNLLGTALGAAAIDHDLVEGLEGSSIISQVADDLHDVFALGQPPSAQRYPAGQEEGSYPDLEITGPGVGDGFYAIDIKVAQRKILEKSPPRQTQSRITLYTGNTYFAYPTLHWDGTFRPFADYAQHLDILGIYTLNQASASRVDDLELVVQEPWRIGSKKRSSTTREYIGAVLGLDDLRKGRGEFKTEAEFYKHWRGFNFRIGRSVQIQLNKLLAQQNQGSPKA